MSIKDAKAVLNIMATADGGCTACVSELFCAFIANFPKRERLAKKLYKEHFDEEISYNI